MYAIRRRTVPQTAARSAVMKVSSFIQIDVARHSRLFRYLRHYICDKVRQSFFFFGYFFAAQIKDESILSVRFPPRCFRKKQLHQVRKFSVGIAVRLVRSHNFRTKSRHLCFQRGRKTVQGASQSLRSRAPHQVRVLFSRFHKTLMRRFISVLLQNYATEQLLCLVFIASVFYAVNLYPDQSRLEIQVCKSVFQIIQIFRKKRVFAYSSANVVSTRIVVAVVGKIAKLLRTHFGVNFFRRQRIFRRLYILLDYAFRHVLTVFAQRINYLPFIKHSPFPSFEIRIIIYFFCRCCQHHLSKHGVRTL